MQNLDRRADIFYMCMLILLLGICLAFVAGNLATKTKPKDCCKTIGCYYTISLPNDDRGLLVKDIDIHLCSHMFYTYVGINSSGLVEVAEPYTDIEHRGYTDFNNLRQKNPNLKTLAAMQVVDENYIQNINNKPLIDPKLRQKLVNSIVSFVKKYGFNGVDIDYSDPPPQDKKPEDKTNFVYFLKALRERFDKEHLILTVKVDSNEKNAEVLYDIKGISTYAHFINLKAYDFHREYQKEKNVGHPAPLLHSPKENSMEGKKNIDYVVQYWIKNHADPNKILIGTSFKGASYSLADPSHFTRGSPISQERGEYDQAASYGLICDHIKKWSYYFDNEQKVPYVHSRNQVIAYDDERSIKEKAIYARDHHLGGAMVDNMEDDDFGARCGKKFPLMKALDEILRNKCSAVA
ncbi:chitinase-3-like protein 1 [Belonocnema kinseyi]|uniref:chitinase-3-like protein 1 n=1 Tax=Belonocnema kinseyi TaxID=2817044 RepID=UPI00143D7C53|nr:chitinase-3-like protein 1 [Belonocnema kinseyi]